MVTIDFQVKWFTVLYLKRKNMMPFLVFSPIMKRIEHECAKGSHEAKRRSLWIKVKAIPMMN